MRCLCCDMRPISLLPLRRRMATTRLGRWCTPAYAKSCDPGLKAHWAARDNGLDLGPLPERTKPPEGKKEPVDDDALPWDVPTLVTVCSGFGM